MSYSQLIYSVDSLNSPPRFSSIRKGFVEQFIKKLCTAMMYSFGEICVEVSLQNK